MPVRMIFDSGQPCTGRAFTDCMQGARTHAIPIVRAQRGMRWNSGDDVSLNILAPSPPMLVDTGDDINENSIVTRLTYVNHSRTLSELFMGDAGEASEARLLASEIDLHADVPLCTDSTTGSTKQDNPNGIRSKMSPDDQKASKGVPSKVWWPSAVRSRLYIRKAPSPVTISRS
jgi:hypothetical protein